MVSVRDGQAGLPLSGARPRRGRRRPASASSTASFRSRRATACSATTADGAPGEWRPPATSSRSQDGRLVFVGRTVEIINVGGAKVHPLPIEELVSSVPGVVIVRGLRQAERRSPGRSWPSTSWRRTASTTRRSRPPSTSACSDLPGPGARAGSVSSTRSRSGATRSSARARVAG